ncbi:L-rhamnose 1-epimeras-like protein [Rhizodiscina lignyota]|uniref:L-rhamnose 1-epimeras-like protein n=1 Tax=Rhizodiscina lignyota TaxID=1504668 RepID=A0A9P4IL40_9PEZI|nr:L-rhamnose 1-epimeras-like protein [Rhizodiscina lignyota]
MASKEPPRRTAQFIYLKPEHLDEYKEIHEKVWSEVLQAIKESNIADYSIFLSLTPRPTLFASFKYVGNDYDSDMLRMASHPKVQEWWRLTDGMQESPIPGAKGSAEGPWWGQMDEVFRLE